MALGQLLEHGEVSRREVGAVPDDHVAVLEAVHELAVGRLVLEGVDARRRGAGVVVAASRRVDLVGRVGDVVAAGPGVAVALPVEVAGSGFEAGRLLGPVPVVGDDEESDDEQDHGHATGDRRPHLQFPAAPRLCRRGQALRPRESGTGRFGRRRGLRRDGRLGAGGRLGVGGRLGAGGRLCVGGVLAWRPSWRGAGAWRRRPSWVGAGRRLGPGCGLGRRARPGPGPCWAPALAWPWARPSSSWWRQRPFVRRPRQAGTPPAGSRCGGCARWSSFSP